MELAVGRALKQGKYTLQVPPVQENFCTTYRATTSDSKRTVLVRTLDKALRRHAKFNQFCEQFLADARKIAQCQHPHLARVLDWFEEAGQPFIVVEYVPGPTLAHLVKPGQPLSVKKALHYVRQVGQALTVVHCQGLLHRDVKPQNIVRRQGAEMAVLTNFALACELTPGIAQTHISMLSAGYAAPEQYLSSARQTQATDLYALAATLYCLLVGHPPVAAPLRDRIPLLDLRQFQPTLNPAVEAAIVKGLAMNPDRRPHTIAEWLALLPREGTVAAANTAPPPSATASSPAAKEANANALRLPTVPQSTRQGKTKPAAIAFHETPVVPLQSITAPMTATTPSPGRRSKPPFVRSASAPRTSNRAITWALLASSAIAGAAGLGFGFALRTSTTTSPLRIPFFQSNQSFPPRDLWPVVEPVSPDDLYESSVSDFQPANNSTEPNSSRSTTSTQTKPSPAASPTTGVPDSLPSEEILDRNNSPAPIRDSQPKPEQPAPEPRNPVDAPESPRNSGNPSSAPVPAPSPQRETAPPPAVAPNPPETRSSAPLPPAPDPLPAT